MLQEITIRTENAEALKPLVRAAMEREIKLLEYSVQRTRDALRVFEQRFNMATEEFERKFNSREIEESLDFIDWWMETEALHYLVSQLQSMREAQLD